MPDRRNQYIKKANGGVASALNTGIKAMTSAFFCWLSHDDVYTRHKIRRQVRAYWPYRRDKDVILISNYRLIDSEGRLITSVRLDHALIAAKPAYAVFRGLVHGCSVFAPRRLFDEVGVFDETLPYTQDYDLWLRSLGNFRFVHMKQCLIKSRWHSEQNSKKGDYRPEHDSFWIKAMQRFGDGDKIASAAVSPNSSRDGSVPKGPASNWRRRLRIRGCRKRCRRQPPSVAMTRSGDHPVPPECRVAVWCGIRRHANLFDIELDRHL